MKTSKIISDSKYQLLNNLNGIFLKDNIEAIWQLQSVDENPTQDGVEFTSPLLEEAPSPLHPFVLSEDFIMKFDSNDLRKFNWTISDSIDGTVYTYPYKYKEGVTVAQTSEYPVIFRLAEQLLIRAEARAQQDKLTEASEDLNLIRSRAGLLNTLASTKSQMLNAIFEERRKELFLEYGHRWFDLKRTEQLNTVMNTVTPIKGGTWETTDMLYPIPLKELNSNTKMKQNPGYE